MSGGVEVEKPIHRIEHKPQQKYHQPRKPKREGKQGSYSSSSKTQHQRLQDNRKCSGCGGNHGVGKRDKVCPAWGKQCHKCQRMNHFASVCKATTPQQAAKTHFVQTKSSAEHELTMPTDEYELPLYKSDTIGSHVKPYMCTVTLNGIPTMMEIDTGATTSLISEAQFKQIQLGKLNLSLITEELPKLRTYSGEIIQPLGQVMVEVGHENQNYHLPLLIIPGKGPNLLGRDWLQRFQLNWSTVHRLEGNGFKEMFPELFKKDLGTLKN
ncbi:uncharacterized protein LOC117107953, partial [Anneissia japonica]|uniref:uncharacterized protein LOC117107953 n=1 Tax=Anneissia japonica TaxID=1529436 RepID=UPI0014258613